MIIIRLTVDDWPLCYAHHYVNADGSNFTDPDPKWIQIDDVIFPLLGVRSRLIIIRLTVDDWPLCYAHHYVNADGSHGEYAAV